MGFYEQISRHYDTVFPLSPAALNFLKALYREHNARTVLDVACGSGTYVKALLDSGFDAFGTDIDDAMVEKAQDKTSPDRIRQGDMQQASAIFGTAFDGMLCIGNSLVHLEDEIAIVRTLKEFARLLKPGGAACIQIINYDRILKDNIDRLPTIKSPENGLTFERQYELRRGIIYFNTELTVPEGIFRNSIPLFPLLKESLEKGLIEAGFANTAFYGDFQGTPWHSGTYATIAAAIKL